MKLSELRKRFMLGENISKLLSGDKGLNSESNIEIAYELQAGSYSKLALENLDFLDSHTKEKSDIIIDNAELDAGCWMLDAGTGEMTTLSGILRFLPKNINIKSFDIGLSRILAGNSFIKNNINIEQKIDSLVAEMSAIPFPDKCFDLVITVHALEPNHGNEDILLKELLRVCGKKAIFFEPSYENNTDEGRARMDSLGYVRDLKKHIENNGGELIKKIKLNKLSSSLNPTYAYIVKPLVTKSKKIKVNYTCPISSCILKEYNGYLWSEEGMYAYPIIEGVPILKKNSAVILVNRC